MYDEEDLNMTCLLLTLCLLGNVSPFLLSTNFFSKSIFSKNSFRKTIRVSSSLDQDHARNIDGHGLGPNCLQMLSAGDTSRQRVKDEILTSKYSFFEEVLSAVIHSSMSFRLSAHRTRFLKGVITWKYKFNCLKELLNNRAKV